MRFQLGQTVMTRGVNDAIADNAKFSKEVLKAFQRYVSCDWGDLYEEDKHLNDLAVKNGDDRILAKYETCIRPIYIITEWDRSVTTILFTDEY